MDTTESSQLAVDIPERQLLDWLKSRSRISRKWNVALKQLREHIKSSLTDFLPEELQEKYHSSENIYYFEVQDILNFVRSRQEVTGKDWFGRSKDRRLRTWEEIIEKYEKDNLILAEAAQRISQLTLFEIPRSKNDMAKQETLISTLTKRQVELRKKLDEATKDCQKFFEGFNLDPSLDIDLQVEQLKSKLPNIFREIVSVLQSKRFSSVLEYHDNFLKSQMPNRRMEDLSFLRQCVLSNIDELYPENAPTSDTPSISDSVQVLGKGQENINVTSRGIEQESSIDWGEDLVAVQDSHQFLKDCSDKGSEGSCKESTESDSTQGNSSACSLMNYEFRKSVEADLLELKSFVERRIKDTEEALGNPLFVIFNHEVEPSERNLFHVEVENLREMLKQVNDALDLFRGPLISRILLLCISRRYEGRLKRDLQERLQRIQKIKSTMDICEQEKEESAKLRSEAEYRYYRNMDILHNLKKLVEDRLASEFPGSHFHIVLDINSP